MGTAAPGTRRVAAASNRPAAPARALVEPAPAPTVEIIRGDKRAHEVVAQE